MAMLAAATGRGELAALVDTFDMFDVESMAAAGVRLDRLLWVRGETSTSAFPPATAGRRQPGADRAIERALKATNLVLQAGGMSLVALDLADAPIQALRRIPMTTWLRLQKVLEGQQAAVVVTGTVPLSRSAGGVTLALSTSTRNYGHDALSAHVAGCARSVLSPEGTNTSPYLCIEGLSRAGARDSGLGNAPFPGIESDVRIQRARLVPGMGAPVRLTAAAQVA
jgi:hypothetical protein